jgi:hypothetical protein
MASQQTSSASVSTAVYMTQLNSIMDKLWSMDPSGKVRNAYFSQDVQKQLSAWITALTARAKQTRIDPYAEKRPMNLYMAWSTKARGIFAQLFPNLVRKADKDATPEEKGQSKESNQVLSKIMGVVFALLSGAEIDAEKMALIKSHGLPARDALRNLPSYRPLVELYEKCADEHARAKAEFETWMASLTSEQKEELHKKALENSSNSSKLKRKPSDPNKPKHKSRKENWPNYPTQPLSHYAAYLKIMASKGIAAPAARLLWEKHPKPDLSTDPDVVSALVMHQQAVSQHKEQVAMWQQKFPQEFAAYREAAVQKALAAKEKRKAKSKSDAPVQAANNSSSVGPVPLAVALPSLPSKPKFPSNALKDRWAAIQNKARATGNDELAAHFSNETFAQACAGANGDESALSAWMTQAEKVVEEYDPSSALGEPEGESEPELEAEPYNTDD